MLPHWDEAMIVEHQECRVDAFCGDERSTMRLGYVRAMIACHAQQARLSTLIYVLGYVPHVVGEQERSSDQPEFCCNGGRLSQTAGVERLARVVQVEIHRRE